MMMNRKSTLILAAALAVTTSIAVTVTARAGVSFGNFEDGTTDGWGTLTSNGLATFQSPVSGAVIVPSSGVDLTNVLDLTASGFNGGVSGGSDLGYDFVANNTAAAFLANDVITFNWEVAPNSTSSGYAQLYSLIINAPGAGYTTVGGLSQGAADPNITNQYPSYTGQSNTYSFNYDAIKAQISANPGYIQFGITTNNGGGAPPDFYFDNFKLSSLSGASTWNVATSGDWNVSTNWDSGVPNAIDAEADLLGSISVNRTLYTDTPITLGKLIFNNSAASYAVTGAVGSSLTMQTSTGSAVIDVQGGTHEINLPLILATNTTFQTDTSSSFLLIADPLTINAGFTLTTTGLGKVSYLSTVTLQAGAKANLATSSSIAGLNLASNSKVSLTLGSNGNRVVLQTTSLNNSGGTLDLGNGAAIVHGGATLTSITTQIATAFAKGAWTGLGITSSAAATDSSHLTAVGVIQATSAGTIDGTAYSTGDIVTKYTYYGDANLDGKVDGSDYTRIDSGLLTHSTGWMNGDFNYDNVVNGSDYTLIDNAFNRQSAQIAAVATAQVAGVSAVPEPTTLALITIALPMLSRRRRR